MSSARNRQPNLFHMEEQMSLEPILDTEIKIWFKISVSKVWNRGRKCSLFFLTCFPVRKHVPFYPMDCSQSLMLKAVLFIELLIQLHWLNKTKRKKTKKHRASDGCCTGRRSQLWPAPAAGRSPHWFWTGNEHVSGEILTRCLGGALVYTTHLTARVQTRVHQSSVLDTR